MKLITAQVRKSLKPLYTFEKRTPEETPVAVKFFNPAGTGTWYITEWDGSDIMFGLCSIHEPELGYVSFRELSEMRLSFGLSIERDMYWQGTLADAMRAEGYAR